MKISVLSGSPKGVYSITLQSIEWLKKHYPNDDFHIHNIGQGKGIFKDPSKFNVIVEDMIQSDLILFVYPVYTFLAPSPLHHFMEVLKGHARAFELAGKWVTQLTTSKHFYDNTAQDWLNENLTDLKMNVVEGFSADMDDLLTEEGRSALNAFWHRLQFKMNWSETRRYLSPQSKEKQLLILTDYEKDSMGLLQGFVERFRKQYSGPVTLLDVSQIRIDGGCLGCFNCATDGKCVYKDGFDTFLRSQIQTADATLYAGIIQDHSLGWRFKQFDDRQFCNGHRTLSIGKPVGYLLLGNLEQEYQLKKMLEARAQVGHLKLCGILDSSASDNTLAFMADQIQYAYDEKANLPQNFLGIGGMTIFRDLIYVMGGLMKADYKFYKTKGFFKSLPHRQWKRRLGMIPVGWLLSSEKIRVKIRPRMNAEMIKPYKKAIDKK